MPWLLVVFSEQLAQEQILRSAQNDGRCYNWRAMRKTLFLILSAAWMASLSGQIQGMTFEEEMSFLRERVPPPNVRHPGKAPNKGLQPTGLGKHRSREPRAAKAARR